MRLAIVAQPGDRVPGGGSVAIWIQTESRYFDLRIPWDRPRFARRRSLDDFDRVELAQLAGQSGDTGVCTIRNRVAHWRSDPAGFGFGCLADATTSLPRCACGRRPGAMPAEPLACEVMAGG